MKTEINWLRKQGDSVDSYESACQTRMGQTLSPEMRRRYRLEYGILKRFDIDGVYPDSRRKEPLVKRGAYYQLNPEFQEVIDLYKDVDLHRGLKPRTVKGNASAGACFLSAMQKERISHLSEINEEAAMSFFTDSSGNVILSNGYRKQISLVFKADLAQYTCDARRILAYLPRTRPGRKNIRYLQPEETQCLHEALDCDSLSVLSLRNKAVGILLFFTGLRACDVSALALDDIDWENDEIRIIQNKTDAPLSLPLTAIVGNALYDYITLERPESDDPHVFLGENRPHDPITADAVWHISSKVYDAASIRMSDGERRGSHLFRYNAATTLIGNGISRPVVSATLGHEDPSSLDYKRIKKHATAAHSKCKEVPLNTYVHLFRHAKALHWIEDGLSIVEVQFLLGHEQIETTMKYLDITTQEKIKALATLENEKEQKTGKKWKKSDGSLTDFCGLKRQK